MNGRFAARFHCMVALSDDLDSDQVRVNSQPRTRSRNDRGQLRLAAEEQLADLGILEQLVAAAG